MRRRLSAFILMFVTALMGIVAIFTGSLKNVNTGMEFSNNTTFVYEVTHEGEGSVDLNSVADEMERRLEMAEVTFYKVEKEGEDQVRVTVGGDDQQLNHVKNLMSYNADFTIASTDDEVQYTSDEIFKDCVAYVDYINQYPIVVFPVSDSTKLETLREHAASLGTPAEGEQKPEEQEAAKEKTSLVLWADKEEGDDYENATNPENPDYEKIREKVFLTFDSAEENLYYDDTHTSIAKTVSYTSEDGQAVENPTPEQVRSACLQAQQVVNFFNVGKLDYDVEFIYSINNPASVENLIILGNNDLTLNFKSGIVIATIVSMVLAGLFLAISYKWGSLVALLTGAGTVVVTIAAYNGLAVEFGLGTVIGLFAIGILALFTNVSIFEKIKDELHKGRTLKKANHEGQKRANFLVLDLSLALFVLSFLAFFVGGELLKETAVVVALGSLFNLLITWLGNKLLMWPLCNDSYLQDHKEILGVRKENIPDTLNEEKQRYFGEYDGRDFTKHKKIFGGVLGGLGLVAAVTTIVLGAINKPIFNYGSEYDSTYRVQFKMKKTSALADASALTKVLTDNGVELESTLEFDQQVSKDDKDITYFYYTGVISTLPEEDSEILANDKVYDAEGNLDVVATLQQNLLVKYIAQDSDIELKVSEAVSHEHLVNPGYVAIAVGCGIAIVGIYLFIRYGISKALAGVLITELSSLLTIGLFIVCRISFSDIVILGLFAVAALGLITSIYMFNRDKELAIDIKEIDSNDRLVKTVNTSFGPIARIAILTFFVASFFVGFGPRQFELVFLLMAFGSALTLLVVTTLLGPTFFTFRKGFSKIKISDHPSKRKSKKNKKEEPKSAEPEEAIFIGIND